MSTNRNYIRRRDLPPVLNLPENVTELVFSYVDELAYKEYKYNIHFDDKDNDLSLTQRQFILYLARHYDDFDIYNFLNIERIETTINEDLLLDYLGEKYDLIYISKNIAEYEFKIGRTNKVLILENISEHVEEMEEIYFKFINERFEVGVDPNLRIHIDLCFFDKDLVKSESYSNKYINSIHFYAPYVNTLKNFVTFDSSKVVLHFPSLTYIQDFMIDYANVESFVLKAPLLTEILNGFLYNYDYLKSLEIYAPELELIGDMWLKSVNNLKFLKMETPKLRRIGEDHYNFTSFDKNNYKSESLPWEKFKALLT